MTNLPFDQRTLRILVTGSRDFDDYDIVRAALAAAVYQQLPAVIVHGACPSGADAIASWWVRQLGRNLDITEERHPAVWDSCGHDCPQKPHRIMKKPGDTHHPGNMPDYCPKAGPRRNRTMIARGAGLCVAFFKKGAANYGTTGCVNLAKAAGIDIRPVVA
jgi:hypothetical protein